MPDNNMTAVVRHEAPSARPSAFSYQELERLAGSIAQSNLFGIKTRDQAIALMMIAHAEGRHPALAARDYDVIQGRPSKKAEAMMRDFMEGGGRVQWHALTDELADATFSHPAGGTVRISWDMKRASQAGLGGKDNWKKFPRQMLRSRTISEGVRTVYPLATSGMYVPEEAADIAPAYAGNTIDARAEPALHIDETPARPGGMVEEARKAAAEKSNGKHKVTFSEWLEAVSIRLAGVQSIDDYNLVVAADDVQAAIAKGSEKQRAALEDLLRPVRERFMPAADDGWPLPEPAAA